MSAGNTTPAGAWLRSGSTVYTLKQEGWRRGEPVMVNRVRIAIDGEEPEAVAERVMVALNATEDGSQAASDTREGEPAAAQPTPAKATASNPNSPSDKELSRTDPVSREAVERLRALAFDLNTKGRDGKRFSCGVDRALDSAAAIYAVLSPAPQPEQGLAAAAPKLFDVLERLLETESYIDVCVTSPFAKIDEWMADAEAALALYRASNPTTTDQGEDGR